MSVSLQSAPVVAADRMVEWSRAAAQAACRVPASGTEAVDWTVRGWAEVALGCAALGGPAAFSGLDEVVRTCGIPCAGPYAERLRALRVFGAESRPPAWYFGTAPKPDRTAPLTEPVREACLILAEYCDAVGQAAARSCHRRRQVSDTPAWATAVDHLRWGERLRVSPGAHRSCLVVSASVPAALVRRSWMRLPSGGPQRAVLIRPSGNAEATVRQRVRQGLHNGAHLDHLVASAAVDAATAWAPSRIEFGSGLLAAEAYAMSVELLAAAECAATGRRAEVRELCQGFAGRMGRMPGFSGWWARDRGGPFALRLAATEPSREFATLPILASRYVTGPLELIAGGWADPLIPADLAGRMRARWSTVCARSQPAAMLTAAAKRHGFGSGQQVADGG